MGETEFQRVMSEGYAFEGASLLLGAPLLDGTVAPDARVRLLGIGEALVTVLSPRGTPTPVVATLVAPPLSLMGPISPEDLEQRAEPKSVVEQLGQALGSPAGRTLQRELVRGLFGVLGIRTGTRRRRSVW